MKRKLSVGIALIGRSQILLLDEPSAAVGAAAKRHLWQMIRRRGARQTAILTTHSMEEAEALCDRLAIQVLGQLRCLGSPIHIRHRYGQGYRLELFMDRSLSRSSTSNSENERNDGITRFVHDQLSEKAEALEVHPGRYLFQLPPMDGSAGSVSLATVFTEVSRARQRLHISEYSLWRPSLEQVFLRFAQEQQEVVDREAHEAGGSTSIV